MRISFARTTVATLLWAQVLVLLSGVSSARTIHVPDDSTTIQSGINGAIDGDTVLVHPGTYVENISFMEHNIVLGSFYLTTGDSSFIDRTVIDGDSSGAVVTFLYWEDSTAVLTGFTIRHGLSVHGGGIHCERSSPTIRGNHIEANLFDARTSVGRGSGIYCKDARPRIINNVIRNNSFWGTTHNYAGGIYCESSEPVIADNLIINNESANVGGGICLLYSGGLIEGNTITGNYSRYGGAISCGNSSPMIRGNVIYDNNAVTGDGLDIFAGSTPLIINNIIVNNDELGIFWDDSEPLIVNTIVWGNSVFGRGGAVFSYCCIEGGFEGTGNIDLDPSFRDPANGDFHLTATTCGDPDDSPCIDAGRPEDTDDLLDCQWGLGTERADMGAFGGNSQTLTSIEDHSEIRMPAGWGLSQNYPNPFNPSTTIEFGLAERGHVRLEVINIVGQTVAILVDAQIPAGAHRVKWDGTDDDGNRAASGVYLYRMSANERSLTRKMMLLK